MLRKCLFLAVFLAGAGHLASADTVQLKDQASISGKILAEKKDQVVVDVGYTVLAIPRDQVAAITRSEGASAARKGSGQAKAGVVPVAKLTEETQSAFYHTAGKPVSSRSVRELVDELGEAVVQVRTPSGLGSGFIINEDGFLLTNFHVIEGETQISVDVYHQDGGQIDRKSYKQVRIVAMNKFADLALLKIEEKDAPRFRYVVLGSSDARAVGERVFAIGSPLGLERTVTEGILSTKTRQMQGELYLQTTAQINPGNSGGPLFDLGGEVIGITNMKITFGEGIGFAIPVEAARYFLDHRDAYAYSNDNPGTAYRYLEPPSRTRHAVVDQPE